jgi:hypothetical protein
MNQSLATRNEVLEQLVRLKGRHATLAQLQFDRLSEVSISSVPDAVAVDLERVVIVEEQSVLEEFARLAAAFPAYVPSVPEPDESETKSDGFGWFSRKRREPACLPESVDDRDAKLQHARLVQLLASVVESLGERRAALGHVSYLVKRAAVELNQSSAIVPDDHDARAIDRERHRLETLASMIDKTIGDVVLSSRAISDVWDAVSAESSAPAPALLAS